jgi:hypothetical protein
MLARLEPLLVRYGVAAYFNGVRRGGGGEEVVV